MWEWGWLGLRMKVVRFENGNGLVLEWELEERGVLDMQLGEIALWQVSGNEDSLNKCLIHMDLGAFVLVCA